MECCGDPFAVGGRVSWSLTPTADRDWLEATLGPALARQVTHEEDHHGLTESEPNLVEGVVVSIRAVRAHFAMPSPHARAAYPVAGSGRATWVHDSTALARDADESRRFVGWVVALDPL